MYAVRLWSVRRARQLEIFYNAFERLLAALHPVFEGVGYGRLEKPVAALERAGKGFLFDCRMCGHCILSSAGMSCPMNCPKSMRNGPCGGVREGGFCEVRPEMRCVWVEAWKGSRSMKGGGAIANVQPPLDRRLQGASSWLRVARQKGEAMKAAQKP